MSETVLHREPLTAVAEIGLGEHETYARMVWRRFLHHRLAVVGGIFVLVLCLSAALAGIIAPHDPTNLDTSKRFIAPFLNWNHPLDRKSVV